MGLSLYSDIWVNRIANAKNKTKKQDLIYCDIYRAANLLIKSPFGKESRNSMILPIA